MSEKWKEQGIWNDKWSEMPDGKWKHDEPPEVDPSEESEFIQIESDEIGPLLTELQALRQAKREQDRQASRPINQFFTLVSKETKCIAAAIGDCPAINTIAYDNVRKEWISAGIWSNKWVTLPGMQWMHERPANELLREYEADFGSCPPDPSPSSHGHLSEAVTPRIPEHTEEQAAETSSAQEDVLAAESQKDQNVFAAAHAECHSGTESQPVGTTSKQQPVPGPSKQVTPHSTLQPLYRHRGLRNLEAAPPRRDAVAETSRTTANLRAANNSGRQLPASQNESDERCQHTVTEKRYSSVAGNSNAQQPAVSSSHAFKDYNQPAGQDGVSFAPGNPFYSTRVPITPEDEAIEQIERRYNRLFGQDGFLPARDRAPLDDNELIAAAFRPHGQQSRQSTWRSDRLVKQLGKASQRSQYSRPDDPSQNPAVEGLPEWFWSEPSSQRPHLKHPEPAAYEDWSGLGSGTSHLDDDGEAIVEDGEFEDGEYATNGDDGNTPEEDISMNDQYHDADATDDGDDVIYVSERRRVSFGGAATLAGGNYAPRSNGGTQRRPSFKGKEKAPARGQDYRAGRNGALGAFRANKVTKPYTFDIRNKAKALEVVQESDENYEPRRASPWVRVRKNRGWNSKTMTRSRFED